MAAHLEKYLHIYGKGIILGAQDAAPISDTRKTFIPGMLTHSETHPKSRRRPEKEQFCFFIFLSVFSVITPPTMVCIIYCQAAHVLLLTSHFSFSSSSSSSCSAALDGDAYQGVLVERDRARVVLVRMTGADQWRPLLREVYIPPQLNTTCLDSSVSYLEMDKTLCCTLLLASSFPDSLSH